MDAYLRPSELAMENKSMFRTPVSFGIDGWYIKKYSDQQFVIEQSFWPLIGFVDSKRKLKKETIKAVVSTEED